MIVRPHGFPGVHLITTDPRRDSRGQFTRLYDVDLFEQSGLHRPWLQENEALTTQRHVIRGLHFQKWPSTETKLIRCAVGAILDVFVDIRRDSPTFGRWAGIHLSAETGQLLYLPRGFAHGYCTLSDVTLVAYKVDSRYDPSHEGALNWADPDLGIVWPTRAPILSDKDRAAPRLRDLVPLDVDMERAA